MIFRTALFFAWACPLFVGLITFVLVFFLVGSGLGASFMLIFIPWFCAYALIPSIACGVYIGIKRKNAAFINQITYIFIASIVAALEFFALRLNINLHHRCFDDMMGNQCTYQDVPIALIVGGLLAWLFYHLIAKHILNLNHLSGNSDSTEGS